MTLTRPPERMREGELIGLLSFAMALSALGVGLILPAFAEMRPVLSLAEDSNRLAGAITAYILGLSGGTLVYGPVSDRLGRKPALRIGFAVYAGGAAASVLAAASGSIRLLVATQVVWGVGAAGPRIVALAIVRDLYDGDRMARIMSSVFAVFTIVPILAPVAGAAVVDITSWRGVFWSVSGLAVVVALWATRLQETRPAGTSGGYPVPRLIPSALRVLRNRRTVLYTVAMMFSFGAFFSYIASSELLIGDVFDRGDLFPWVYGGVTALMSIAMVVNAALVESLTTERVVVMTLAIYLASALVLTIGTLAGEGIPGFTLFLVTLSVIAAMHGLLVSNLNSLSLDPMGDQAGTAGSIVGSVSTGGGALLGSLIDRAYDGTVVPLSAGFVGAATVALVLCLMAGRAKEANPTGHRPPETC